MAHMDEKFLKPYDPAATESRLYKEWEESGYFNPDNLPPIPAADGGAAKPRTEPFSIVLPPPNVTGVLHVGHAYEDSLQDAVIRFQRMRGKKALWVPGTDSAAIATQARVEKNIQKDEGKSRHDLGREELVRRVSDFAKNSESTILGQVRRMGASLDWSRYAYTLDDKRYRAVMTAFVDMFKAGLIYRGYRIVNWDPKGQTTISDDEIVHEDRQGTLYTFRYSKDFPIPVATTRPETKLGDVAVAVSPNDTRYAAYVGQIYEAEFCGEKLSIKIVADEAVDPAFGTGAVGVTPAHSMTDWEIKDRHQLPIVQVIDQYGKMMLGTDGSNGTPAIKGKKVAEARAAVVEWLRAQDLLEKEEAVPQTIATAERSGGIIEPLPMLQWWIDVSKKFVLPHSEIPGIPSGSETSLKALMRAAVESGAVSMPQDGFRNAYFHWIDNLRDWCISRQIWFGHRIPVWYRGEEIYCGLEAPQGDGWEQETDVLDTWFSSALWTFSTLGWPEKTPDLATYHPTSFMSPAYEILNLWVSRMILMSGFHLGQVPFKTVMIHGLVRDSKGQKFSKSLANGIDPLKMIDTYGADALRMGLLVGTAIGNDAKFDEQKVKGYKHFANKLWNIARFILESAGGEGGGSGSGDRSGPLGQALVSGTAPAAFGDADRAAWNEFAALIEDVTKDMEEYRLYMAAEKLYHYAWHRLADQLLEESKPIFRSEDAAAKASRAVLLLGILESLMRLLHPFMPFVTEEIWRSLPGNQGKILMVAAWPSPAAVE
jgi:valyl-tRNA synthetase